VVLFSQEEESSKRGQESSLARKSINPTFLFIVPMLLRRFLKEHLIIGNWTPLVNLPYGSRSRVCQQGVAERPPFDPEWTFPLFLGI